MEPFDLTGLRARLADRFRLDDGSLPKSDCDTLVFLQRGRQFFEPKLKVCNRWSCPGCALKRSRRQLFIATLLWADEERLWYSAVPFDKRLRERIGRHRRRVGCELLTVKRVDGTVRIFATGDLTGRLEPTVGLWVDRHVAMALLTEALAPGVEPDGTGVLLSAGWRHWAKRRRDNAERDGTVAPVERPLEEPVAVNMDAATVEDGDEPDPGGVNGNEPDGDDEKIHFVAEVSPRIDWLDSFDAAAATMTQRFGIAVAPTKLRFGLPEGIDAEEARRVVRDQLYADEANLSGLVLLRNSSLSNTNPDKPDTYRCPGCSLGVSSDPATQRPSDR